MTARSGGATSRRTSLWLAAGAAVAFGVLAALLVPWEWVPGGRVVPVAPEELLGPEQLRANLDYSAAQRRLAWVQLALSAAVALALGLTPWGAALVRRLPGRWWWRTTVAAALVVLAGALATLPVRLLVRTNAVEVGISTQSLPGWLRDWAVGLGLSAVYAVLTVLLVVVTARRWARAWPAVFGGVAALLVVAGSWLYPVVVEPLFHDFEPLPDGALRAQVFEVAEAEGVDLAQVLVADASRRTTALNAYVSGLGDTRRVVLYDTLLDDAPPEETLVIVAHELAHARNHDVAVGTALAALGVLAGAGLLGLVLASPLPRRLGVRGPADPAVVPLVLALVTVATLAAAPVENAVSRAMEARADREAVAVTDEAAFERMQVRLATRSLADPDPPVLRQRWFGSHPSLVQWVDIARGVGEALERRAR